LSQDSVVFWSWGVVPEGDSPWSARWGSACTLKVLGRAGAALLCPVPPDESPPVHALPDLVSPKNFPLCCPAPG